jgi:hypothetical protein
MAKVQTLVALAPVAPPQMCDEPCYIWKYASSRLGNDLSAAESALRELQEKGVAKVRFSDSLGLETTMEIRRIDDKLTDAERGKDLGKK